MNPFDIAKGIVAAVGAYIWHAESTKTQYAVFKAEVAQLGKKAKEDAERKETADRKLKEKSDEENNRTLANLRGTVRRLRDDNAGRSAVSQLPAAAGSPDLVCFSRLLLDTAVREYQSAILGIVEKGAEATVNLDTARDWVRLQSQGTP
jgi:hypothetical protein